MKPLRVPAISTFPEATNTAASLYLEILRLLVRDHLPLAGSYNSQRVCPTLLSCPPATGTLPVASRVAECQLVTSFMLPVADQVLLAGSHNSVQLVRLKQYVPLHSPATSTLPPASSVAVCSERGWVIARMADHVPLARPNISAKLRIAPLLFSPRETRTLPLVSRVAV